MNNVLIESQIVESTPIMGILNVSINSDLKVVHQIEFFAFDPNELDKFLQVSTPSGTNFLYDLIITRAQRLKSLDSTFDEEDYEIGMKSQMDNQKNQGNLFLEILIRLGVVKEFVSIFLDEQKMQRVDFTDLKATELLIKI